MAADSRLKVLVVTDPLCSWCWGMATAVEQASARLADVADFGLLLGGINIRSTQPVGEYGRRHLLHIWREVHATTGQSFGFVVPPGMVYNSLQPCLAVAAVRDILGRPPFGYLHRLQQMLFVEGRDINQGRLLADTAGDFAVDPDSVADALRNRGLRDDLAREFTAARSYGTQALPAVLIEEEGERRLLAGGYADADMLEALIRACASGDAAQRRK